ncbi:hypothetical protein EIN_181290 [Entamoeba invadens IP1]|uniref:hypothetical protein n=1 Tax=Entamoeba invadens IP1 TaxID=370355 RepID=UPI0002C3D573|nr:hypothetical protein EIN_181290 [Entamoeba invadens IP1]ELP93972.1 hypothetical protein EIN_181290 [Entamoeba invadens IP1]|eukprot:XP_004260743.1 hypothetical protein EIN_181290 [Entamoeba invadens IP1]
MGMSWRKPNWKKVLNYFQSVRIEIDYKVRTYGPGCLLWGLLIVLQFAIIGVILKVNINVIIQTETIKQYYNDSQLPTTYSLQLPNIAFLARKPMKDSLYYGQGNATFDYTSVAGYYLSLMYTSYLHENVNLASNNYVTVNGDGLDGVVESLCGAENKSPKMKNYCDYYSKFGGYSGLPYDVMAESGQTITVQVLKNLSSFNDLNSSWSDVSKMNVSVNMSYDVHLYNPTDIKQFLYHKNLPLVMSVAYYKRCRNVGNVSEPNVRCTRAQGPDGKYKTDQLHFHEGDVSSAIIVGWNDEGFIIRGQQLGHTKEYYLGMISATEDMFYCGNTFSFDSWISYFDELKSVFPPTRLKFNVNNSDQFPDVIELLKNDDVNQTYYICGDGKQPKFNNGKITLKRENEDECALEIEGWPEKMETIFYPEIHPHGNSELERCFYGLMPYTTYFDYYSHSQDNYGILGIKSYNFTFNKATVEQAYYSKYNESYTEGAYFIVNKKKS